MNPNTFRYRRGVGDVEPTQQMAPSAAPAPVEEEAWQTLDLSLLANASARDQGVNIDKDGDFLVTHLWGTSTGSYNLQVRLYSGRPLSSAPVSNTNMVGTVAFKTPIKPMLYPAGSRISIDFIDTSGADNDIQIVFGGIRLVKR